jgi:hypothetical protein
MANIPSIETVGWAAGLIEGEGCFYAVAGPPRTHCRIRVVMTDRDVLEKLSAAFNVGCVEPYHLTQGLGKKQLYRWDATRRADVLAICDSIYPFMGSRRRAQIDRLREVNRENPLISNAEKVRRTWVTRRANAARAAA